MKQFYFPLYAQIVAVILLNITLIVTLRLVLFSTHFGLGWEELLYIPAEKQVQVVAMIMNRQLQTFSKKDWYGMLKEFEEFYGANFYLLNGKGEEVAGRPTVFPQPVLDKISDASRNTLSTGKINTAGSKGFFLNDRDRMEQHLDKGFAKIFEHTSDPEMFWIGAFIPNKTMNEPSVLIVASPNLWQTHLTSDFRHSLLIVMTVVGLSLLLWWPFLYGITSTLRKVTRVTEKIAEGKFDTSIVKNNRLDELGRLSIAINRMAFRLNSFVKGQKRFLGDIAHELSSPVARLQVGFEILEQSKTPQQSRVIKDIREEIDEISDLINELLAFSKAGIVGKEIRLVPVKLDLVLQKTIAKMCPVDAVTLNVQQDLYCLGDRVILERAFGNVLRNAVRYAAQYGPIDITAVRVDNEALVIISDRGPGVPQEAIEMLGQPFYRPEPSRNRSSGGIGLGLAIVKTCVESCSGTLSIRNNKPTGLQVEIRLSALDAGSVGVLNDGSIFSIETV